MLKSQFMSFYRGTANEQSASQCYDAIEKALYEQGILTRNTLIGALATVRIEVGKSYTPKREDLNYSAESLMRTFPKSFPTIEIANQYARQPEKIANRAYANRIGNGDEASGDGWKHRGATWLQVTGKSNWNHYGLTEENCFDILTNAKVIAQYFKDNNCNTACDSYDWKRVRILVNGGSNGYDDFMVVINQFLKRSK